MGFFDKRVAIMPALLTPFDRKGEIDYGALARLIELEIAEGADGFYACGSSSEVFSLSREERMELLEAVVKHVDGRVPIIAHIGDPSQREACQLAEHAAGLGVPAIAAVPPFYYRYGMDEIAGYYRALHECSGLPVMLYNISMFTGVTFTAANLTTLYREPFVQGIKHTDYNLYELYGIKRLAPEKLAMCGREDCLTGALILGADGAIGSSFNCVGPTAYRLRDLYLAGDLEGAKRAQDELTRYSDALGKAGGFKAIKYVLRLKGLDCGECRSPYQSLSDEAKRDLETLFVG